MVNMHVLFKLTKMPVPRTGNFGSSYVTVMIAMFAKNCIAQMALHTLKRFAYRFLRLLEVNVLRSKHLFYHENH